MASAEAIETIAGSGSASGMERLLIENIRVFCERCDQVIKRGYSEIIRGSPTAELIERHRQELHWSLRLARLFHRATAASDFRDIPLGRLLEVKLRQLEEHWKYIYEPPSKGETERLEMLIKASFPDEPRA